MYAFIFSSSLAGIGGAIQAYNLRIFAPVMLEVNAMIEIMAMAIIGGLGLALGPIVGVITVLGLSEFLRSTGEIRLLVWGLMLIVIILYFPDGLMGSSVQKELLQEKAESFRSKVGMTNNTDSSNDK
jgi:branched-chain amino acid transport system permease protein